MKVHTILYVRDQEESKNFYSTLLNFEPILHVPGMTEFKLSDEHILGLMPEKGIINLLGDKIPDVMKGNGIPRVEIYFRVENPAVFHKKAIELGAKEISPLLKRNWGDDVAYSMDFDGHIIAFSSL